MKVHSTFSISSRWLILTMLMSVVSCHTSLWREPASHEISNSVKQLVDWETKSNAVALRSNDVISIKHFKIPYELVEKNVLNGLDQEILDALIFEVDDNKFVRWIINPEDTKWHQELKSYLASKGIDTTAEEYFQGYLTASRSMIIVDPNSGKSFSMKVSTNNTGGNWRDKKQTWDDANQIRHVSDWIKTILDKMHTPNMMIMEEPLAFGIKELDQGMIMRSLNNIPDGTHYYLPGFSALHEEEGERIAKLNGSDNAYKFWDEHYNRPLGRALAELAAYTGIYFDSPHSQNFLIELDSNYRPTGRIVLRDFGDAYLLKPFIENTDYKNILDIWEPGNIKNQLITGVGLLHGNRAPSWLTQRDYSRYGSNFYEEFERLYGEITGVNARSLEQTRLSKPWGFSYFSKEYPTDSEAWINYFKYANCLSGSLISLSGEECIDQFKRFQKNTFQSNSTCHSAMTGLLLAN